MSFHPFTTLEKLVEIERLIQTAKEGPLPEGARRIDLLKSIAADLRARLELAPSVALLQIERRMTTLHRRRGAGRQEIANAKFGIAEELVARWPTVKQALEQFDETIKKESA